MKLNYKFAAFIVIIGFLFGALVIAGENSADIKSEADKEDSTVTPDSSAVESPKLIAYYFHTTKRCPSCKKLEAYTDEAITAGFEDELESGILEWSAINTDSAGNEHYLKDYQLYTKSVIIQKIEDGEKGDWKNLTKVWELLGNKEKFMEYVQSEIKLYLDN